MKKIILILLCCFSITSLYAQDYGNEWIDYSNTYYKFKVAKNGVYQIPYSTLQSVGLSNATGAGFQLFYKGEEQPIYVTNDGALSNADYIEFYGEANDGHYDTQLFEDPSFQLHTHESLFSDSLTYYLTWDATSTGERFVQTVNDLSSPPTKESYFMHTTLNLHNFLHCAGRPFRLGGANNNFPDFEEGEGFVGLPILGGSSQTYNLNTPAKYSGIGAPTARFETKVVGRSDDFSVIDDHHFRVSIGGIPYININSGYAAYDSKLLETDVFLSNVGTTTEVVYTSVGDQASTDINAVAYTSLTYPRQFNFDDENKLFFTLESNEEKYLEIANFDGGNAPVLYDMTNKLRLFPVFQDGIYRVVLPAGTNTSLKREIYIANTEVVCDLGCSFPCIPDCLTCSANQCAVINIIAMQNINFTNFAELANQGNYILLTHPSLRTGNTDYAQAYADYRASAVGGNYNTVVVNVEELYDQFSIGVPKHPMAIRNFVNYAIDNWINSPAYLFLFGKSVSYDIANSPTAYDACFIPTWGHHPSDNMLAVRDASTYIPQIAVGRVSAKTPNDVRAYYEKVVSYEAENACTLEDRAWTKNFLHIGGGHNASQLNDYLDYLADYEEIVEDVAYAGTVAKTFQQASFNIQPQPDFEAYMNDGAAMITLIGHSTGLDAWNFDIDEPQDYTNGEKDAFPFMFAGSCFVGDIHEFNQSTASMSERFVLADDAGAIGFLATVSFGFPQYLDVFCEDLYTQFSSESYGQPLGYCMLETLNNIYVGDPDDTDYKGIKITSEEFTFQGDPAVILAGSYQNPEYLIEYNAQTQNIALLNPNDATQLPSSGVSPITIPSDLNEVDVLITVNNIGKGVSTPFQISVGYVDAAGNVQNLTSETLTSAVNSSVYNVNVSLDGLGSLPQPVELVVSVDSNDAITEDCEDNNEASVFINLQQDICSGLEEPEITLSNVVYCADDASVLLTATPVNGTFSGSGVLGNTFDPATANSGNNIISYAYTDFDTGCQLFTSLNVNVTPVPSAAFNTSATSICSSEIVLLNINNFDANINYTWDLAGATVLGQTDGQTSVSWNSGGAKNVTLIAENNSCESEMFNININVDVPLIAPNITCGDATLDNVSFGWNTVANATGYNVFVENNLVAQLPAGTTTYSQTATEGETVIIEVVAVGNGACGNSPESVPQACTAQNCAAVDLNINNLQNNYCSDDASFTLSGTPANGSFTLDNIPVTELNPATLPADTYTLTYDLNIGDCAYSTAAQITINETPQPTITGVETLCEGSSADLTVSSIFDDILWSNNETTSTISISEAGTYSVTVTNAAGCQNIDVFNVAIAEEQEVIINTEGEPVLCNGQSLTLAVEGNFQSYNWGGLSLDPSLTVFATGIYSVTVTDINGCAWSNSIEVAEGAIETPSLSINGADETEFCAGTSITLDAGAGYTTYEWFDGTNEQTATFDLADVGFYGVTVTNEAGCDVSQEVLLTLTSIESPEINATVANICIDEESTLTVAGTYDDYVWSTGDTGSGEIVVTAPDVYTVTVTENGCEVMQTIEIFAAEAAVTEAAFLIHGDTEICGSGEVNLVNNSTNANSFVWTVTNDQTDEVRTFEGEEPLVSFDAEGTYSVQLTAINPCDASTDEASLATAVIVSAGPDAEILTEAAELCPGEIVILEGETTASSFLWLDESGLTLESNEVTVNETSTFFYLATDEAGCTKLDSILINIKESCELPNAITPFKVDGFNDTWQIPLADSQVISVEIYNRWGQKVYDNAAYSNADAWNGTNNNGDALGHATYYYIIRIEGNSEVLSGNITILE
ncbi:MAG: C25 family cysteine peptidase [Chitinophagales bacterium]